MRPSPAPNRRAPAASTAASAAAAPIAPAASTAPDTSNAPTAAPLRQASGTLTVATPGRALIDITAQVTAWLRTTAVREGLLTLFLRHTSASLVVQENADADVQGDLQRFLARLVPDGDALFRHRAEGADDMPAHVRAALTAVQLSVPVLDGRLRLGTWQGLYLWEHRTRAHQRTVALHVLGS